MSYTLKLRKEAEFDVAEGFDYYQGKRVGLGDDFLLCIDDALQKIQRNPFIYREIYRELRRISIHRFPYRILYFVQNNHVVVTAVFHARKAPSAWTNRT
ncbi:addiction module toxin RelE [Rheinheimera sp. SA_1]|uniref:type II toxin-antitoxin system RelE/ParE family toxin n=1 Tax=Rheinheimera sp. SA_1 TaxID=1827365 RepID=UPI0008000113|nr:type II toxin-antitoxin system RelE/ParE family toxin [Rheinheimera sp. SA_1]OBP14173.1 addiction module toxin RelE [Rheinheimera sp. SA_1]